MRKPGYVRNLYLRLAGGLSLRVVVRTEDVEPAVRGVGVDELKNT